jgi:hypothetical protein
MVTGTLVAESLRVGAELDGIGLVTRKISRVAVRDPAAGQPAAWTFIEFEAADSDAGRLSTALAAVLDEPGWYVDFRSPAETFVVYSGRVFRYPRGDSSGRAEATAWGRTRGIPDRQLDWPA